MSYENPDEIPSEQNDPYITMHTSDAVRELATELNLIGLKLECIHYYKNEYCSNREPTKCTCPHWFKIKVESLHTRILEPHVWIWVCKRKRVWELRYKDHVEEDFWINTGNRTQEKGSYIHSYELTQVASDIKIIHQAAEIKIYRSPDHDKYYGTIFRVKE